MSWESFPASGKGVLVWKCLSSWSLFDAFISKLIVSTAVALLSCFFPGAA